MSFEPGKGVEADRAVAAAASADPASAGKTTLMPAGRADPAALTARAAHGALRHLRKLMPSLEAAAGGGELPPLLALDARGAVRRLDEALERLRGIAGTRPDIADELEALVAERSAIDPTIERAVSDTAAAWRAEAAPIAAQLGLGRVDIRSDGHARSVTEAKAARGVAHGSTIYLHPERVRPGTPEGREVLAHELVHLAQARRSGTESHQDQRDAAELEAADLAPALAGGGLARAPQHFIDLSRPAADADAAAVATVLASLKPKTDVAWMYLKTNEDAFVNAFVARLGTIPLIENPRLKWVGNLATTFREALRAALGNKVLWYDGIKELVLPADPMRVIDQNRWLDEGAPGKVVDGKEPVGPLTWSPIVGTALAVEVGKSVERSLARMLPRYLIQADEKHPQPVELADLVTSHPMDVVVARMLADQRVLTTVGKPDKHAKKNDTPEAFRHGIRFLQSYQWLGEKDPTLWNWIKVDDPIDATPEEVAATIWLDADKTSRAWAITKTGPYFRVHPGFAHALTGVKDYAPKDWYHPEEDNATALAESSFANEAAIASAAGHPRLTPAQAASPENLAKYKKALEQSLRQLGRMKLQVSTPKLWEPLLPAIHWAEKHLDNLYGFSDERLAALQPVFEGQQSLLFEISGAMTELVGGGTVDADSPLFDVVRDFMIAAGESFLLDASKAQLGKAKRKQAILALDLADGLFTEASTGVRDLTGSETSVFTHLGAESKTQLSGYQKQLVELRAKHADGEAPADGDMELLTAELRELQFISKTRALSVKLAVLADEARSANNDGMEVIANLFHTEIHDLPTQLYGIMTDIRVWVHEPYEKYKKDEIAQLTTVPGTPEHKKAVAQVINSKLDHARNQFEAEVTKKHDLEKVFSSAVETIQDARLRTMILQIILLIAVGVAGGVVGSIVGGAVRGAMIANTAVRAMGVMRAVSVARVAGTLANITADAAINTVGQAMILGDDGDSFLFNLASNAAVLAALRPLHHVASAWKVPATELKNLKLWEKAKVGGRIAFKTGTTVTAEMITAAGVSYAMERAVKGPPKDEQTAAQWVLQGAAMALGRFVSGRMSGIEERLGKLAMTDTHVYLQMKRVKATALHVEKTGDAEKSLEIMLAHQKVLDDEAELLADLVHNKKAKIPADMIETMLAGNRAERGGLQKTAFASVPLHMAGLTPDDASGQIWYGATADISIALHYAHRAGLDVKVVAHDAATREWTVWVEGQHIKIIEDPLKGRPTEARDLTDAERLQARRYAEAAEFMQKQWEGAVKADLDGRAVIEFDHFQLGYAQSGVMNQATMPSSGPDRGSFVVVYEHRGTLSNRGKQELGQGPKKFDAPGIRASEQAPKDAEWTRSEDLDRALQVGRLELQTPAYHGKATELQKRPDVLPEDWKAPNRKFRIKVSDGTTERWFYADRIDNAGGMGPGLVHPEVSDAAGGKIDEMIAGNHVVLGDDPYYFDKLKAGEILVWGGSPTGAWAAEPGVHAPGSHVDVIGDVSPKAGQPKKNWNDLIEEHQIVVEKIASGDADPQLVTRRAELEKDIAAAHSGAATRRNRKPGATYANPDDKSGKVRIEYGTPTKIEVLPDGRVLVTMGAGATMRTKAFDQIVLAHGQNPGAPGGPGGLLGKGAAETAVGSREYGDVPEGSIALRPVYSTTPPHDVIALESIDPPGIRLVGAAYAHKAMEPWIPKGELRDGFSAWLKRMKQAHAPTRDHGVVSEDSTAVTPGIEHQRDKLPQANEALAPEVFKLPGPKETLELHKGMTPDQQDAAVLRFLAIHMRADGGYISLVRLTDGKSGAIIFRVSVGGHEVGVLKVFGSASEARAEIAMLDLLATAGLQHMKAVAARGMASVDPDSGFGGAVLMDSAPGQSVKQMIAAARPGQGNRAEVLQNLEHAMVKVADGLAELHTHFGQQENGKPVMMDDAAKTSDADYMIKKNFGTGDRANAVKTALGPDFDRVKAAVEGKLKQEFMAAKVPATAYLGDANAGNFVLSNHGRRGYADLGLIDVAAMKYGMAPNEHPKTADGDATYRKGDKGKMTGAADLARFLGSLETMYPGTLTPAEVTKLRDVFMREYLAQYKPGKGTGSAVDTDGYAAAEKWYRIELELTVLTTPGGAWDAKQRIMKLLAPEMAP